MQTQHGCCWFHAEVSLRYANSRSADAMEGIRCTALGIAAIAFLPFVLSSSNFCSADGKTLRL